MRKYKSGLFIIKLKLNEEGTACIPDVPFKVYGESYVSNNKRVRLSDIKNVGLEVLAKLDYRVEPYPGNPDVLVEKDKAEAHAGFLGNKWEEIKTKPEYSKHYAVKLKDSKATYDKDGVKTEYDGVDKEEAAKFCQWGETVVEEPIDEKKPK